MADTFTIAERDTFQSTRDITVAQQFLDRGMPVDLMAGGATKLFRAAIAGNVPMIDFLVSAGANVNRMASGPGRIFGAGAPPNVAIISGKPAAVTRLLDHGANPRIHNTYRQTAGHLLLKRGTIDPGASPEYKRKTINRMLDAGLPSTKSTTRETRYCTSLEQYASGHIDCHVKFALYCWELANTGLEAKEDTRPGRRLGR
jgi:hypothetical protein